MAKRPSLISGSTEHTMAIIMPNPLPESPPGVTPGADSLGPRWRQISSLDWSALAIVCAALVLSYWNTWAGLYQVWTNDPDYTHGFLVLPIAMFILYKLWPDDESHRPRTWWPGFLVVAASLGLRIYFFEMGQAWSENITMFLAILGLAFARLGPRAMWKVWPAFAFLLFWFPLPPKINLSLSQPLQGLATWLSCRVLMLSGLWVVPEGNIIRIGQEKLEVAEACNGLSMLMSLSATVVAAASLIPMALIKRIALLLSVIPIALFSNVIRIAVTAWCYHRYGTDMGSKYAHDIAGWLMMPLAMLLVGLELWVMSWLIIETTTDDNVLSPGWQGRRVVGPEAQA